MKARCLLPMLLILSAPLRAVAQVSVPAEPPAQARSHRFHDRRYGVRFRVPPGWSLNRRDGRVSTFHLDARSAPRRARLRGVASIEFNPYPLSTFSGALFYYSVERHTTDAECVGRTVFREPSATSTFPAAAETAPNPAQRSLPTTAMRADLQSIGGMSFAHGHDEHGGICVEARDEVYTAYRKNSCYRFDLVVNTFCSASSGAAEMTDGQIEQIESRMAEILSTVALDWNKVGPQPVTAPRPPAETDSPRHGPGVAPAVSDGGAR